MVVTLTHNVLSSTAFKSTWTYS